MRLRNKILETYSCRIFQQNRQNIQHFAAKTLTDNVLSDEFAYDDDDDDDEDAQMDDDDAVLLTDC